MIIPIIDDPAESIPLLQWKPLSLGSNIQAAQLGTEDDGVYFELSQFPTCYRRGQYRLLIMVCSGENHTKWGCFDDQDQPQRYFHKEENAKSEAEEIAKVLYKDRHKKPVKL